MDLIKITSQPKAGRAKAPFFARAMGTAFEARAKDGVEEIDLYDEIGFFGVTAAEFRARLRGVSASTIRLNINSPGGEVFDGIAMFNDLVRHPAKVEVNVTGVAASAASIVTMAGDQINIADNAFLMIHNAWTIEIGDRHDMANIAEMLGQIDNALAGTYAARTGIKRAEIADMMDAETWLSAKAAVDQGFADDRLASDNEPQAAFDLSVYANVPRAVPRVEETAEGPDEPQTLRDAERMLMRDAGLTRSRAQALLRAVKGVPEAKRDAGEQELREIADLLAEATERLGSNTK